MIVRIKDIIFIEKPEMSLGTRLRIRAEICCGESTDDEDVNIRALCTVV